MHRLSLLLMKHFKLLPVLALLFALYSPERTTAQNVILLEDFEHMLRYHPADETGWDIAASARSSCGIERSFQPGSQGTYAGELLFNLKSGGWGRLQRKVENEIWLYQEPEALRFWLKADGSNREAFVEIDESYTFKWQRAFSLSDTNWHLVTLPLNTFTSADKQEMSVRDLSTIKFSIKKGKARFYIDQLEMLVKKAHPPAIPARRGKSASTLHAPKTVPLEPLVKLNTTNRGYIRTISPNGKYVVFDDGTPFIPIGFNRYNLFDASKHPNGWDTASYLRNAAYHGVNTLRIWLESEGARGKWLETAPGVYNEKQAKRIDDIFDLCEKFGIYLIVSPWDTWRIKHHPQQGALYISDGPLSASGEYITHPYALKMVKKKWKYVIDRWGDRKNLLAWDLINEIDVFSMEPDIQKKWIEEVGFYIKHVDKHRHLTTLSISQQVKDFSIFNSPYIDIVQPHFYAGNPEKGVGDMPSMLQWLLYTRRGGFMQFGKPVLYGELGLGHGGHHPKWTRNVMWTSIALGSAGTSMRWTDQGTWGEVSKEEYLYTAGLRRFIDLVNWKDFQTSHRATYEIQTSAKDTRLYASIDANQAVIWINGIAQDDRLYEPEISIQPLDPGNYFIYIIDADTGEIIERTSAHKTSRPLVFRTPPFTEHIACYIERITPKLAQLGSDIWPLQKKKRIEKKKQQITPNTKPSGQAQISCLKNKTPIEVDGDLSDWKDKTATLLNTDVPPWHTQFPTRIGDGVLPEDEADLSGKLYVGWDDKAIYLGFDVRDETLVFNHDANMAYMMDSIQVYFDLMNKKSQDYIPGNDKSAMISIRSSEKSKPAQLLLGGQHVGKIAARTHKEGYTLELSIPFTELGLTPPTNGQVIGFDVQLNDSDDPNLWRETTLVYAGGGNLNWCDPSVFGELVFME